MPNNDDVLFGRGGSLSSWDALFTAQVETSFALELPAFYRSRAWAAAKEVVDIGTGNGYFISRLAAIFEGKVFVALDRVRDFISLARRSESASAGRVQFVCKDLFDETGNFDFAILRAVLQHQKNFEKLLEKMRDLVRREGCALLIDLDEFEGVYFRPPAPEISDIYERIARRQRESRVNGARNHAEFISLARTTGDWNVLSDERVVVPSTVAGTAELLKRQFLLLLRVLKEVDQAGELASDYDESEERWSKWCQRPDGYSQVALRITELERK